MKAVRFGLRVCGVYDGLWVDDHAIAQGILGKMPLLITAPLFKWGWLYKVMLTMRRLRRIPYSSYLALKLSRN